MIRSKRVGNTEVYKIDVSMWMCIGSPMISILP